MKYNDRVDELNLDSCYSSEEESNLSEQFGPHKRVNRPSPALFSSPVPQLVFTSLKVYFY